MEHNGNQGDCFRNCCSILFLTIDCVLVKSLPPFLTNKKCHVRPSRKYITSHIALDTCCPCHLKKVFLSFKNGASPPAPLIQILDYKIFLWLSLLPAFVTIILYVYRHWCFYKYISFLTKTDQTSAEETKRWFTQSLFHWLSRIRPISGNWLRIWLAMWSS